ncbi:MAG: hypothetical protein M1822_009171 [Bathelium mastoideum]|nr:MAG: hypothetical protein M1822_009171 [Bathelium mastoideum]
MAASSKASEHRQIILDSIAVLFHHHSGHAALDCSQRVVCYETEEDIFVAAGVETQFGCQMPRVLIEGPPATDVDSAIELLRDLNAWSNGIDGWSLADLITSFLKERGLVPSSYDSSAPGRINTSRPFPYVEVAANQRTQPLDLRESTFPLKPFFPADVGRMPKAGQLKASPHSSSTRTHADSVNLASDVERVRRNAQKQRESMDRKITAGYKERQVREPAQSGFSSTPLLSIPNVAPSSPRAEKEHLGMCLKETAKRLSSMQWEPKNTALEKEKEPQESKKPQLAEQTSASTTLPIRNNSAQGAQISTNTKPSDCNSRPERQQTLRRDSGAADIKPAPKALAENQRYQAFGPKTMSRFVSPRDISSDPVQCPQVRPTSKQVGDPSRACSSKDGKGQRESQVRGEPSIRPAQNLPLGGVRQAERLPDSRARRWQESQESQYRELGKQRGNGGPGSHAFEDATKHMELLRRQQNSRFSSKSSEPSQSGSNNSSWTTLDGVSDRSAA